MIVYGDPQFCQPARPLLLRLRSTLDRTNPHSLDQLRALLIQTGQLEQALEDAGVSASKLTLSSLHLARSATDLAASAFCDAWFKSTFQRAIPGDSPARAWAFGEALLAKLATVLYQMELPTDLSLTVKTPEGFAFYTLFPEQYCASALKWAEEHADPGAVLIVGIRSIGTTLSAVVRATLQATARPAERITVRPTGHPFCRKVALPSLARTSFDHAIVVDEGPGISGSSMASAASALSEHDFASITFLPAHDGPPGSSAGPEILETWRRTSKIVTPCEELRWHRLSLLESLARETSRLASGGTDAADGAPEFHPAWEFIYTHAVQSLFGVTEEHPLRDGFDLIQDCSGGLWRQYAFHAESAWPAVAQQFERMKFRCSNHAGAAVLWKFIGFGEWQDGSDPDARLNRVRRLAENSFTPPCIGSFRGFFAQPWIEGVRLTIADGIDASILARVGGYLVASAEPPLNRAELDRATARLTEMLYWNTHEVLGSAFADEARNRARRFTFSEPPLTAGDGRMAPHEWILTPTDSQILKLDCDGHGTDHTVVGRQPIHWDVAGALIEWDLDLNSAAPLLGILEKGGIAIEPESLQFYLISYAAYRMGLMWLGLSQTNDQEERRRLQHGFYFYQNKLANGLKSEALANPIWRSGT